MKVELHFVRCRGVKVPSKEADGYQPLVGELKMCNRWVSPTRTLPALELTAAGVTNGSGLVAVLYEPRLVSLGSNWMRFTGFEIYDEGGLKQLVIQDWRCLVQTCYEN